jgi:hypothetical protein
LSEPGADVPRRDREIFQQKNTCDDKSEQQQFNNSGRMVKR